MAGIFFLRDEKAGLVLAFRSQQEVDEAAEALRNGEEIEIPHGHMGAKLRECDRLIIIPSGLEMADEDRALAFAEVQALVEAIRKGLGN